MNPSHRMAIALSSVIKLTPFSTWTWPAWSQKPRRPREFVLTIVIFELVHNMSAIRLTKQFSATGRKSLQSFRAWPDICPDPCSSCFIQRVATWPTFSISHILNWRFGDHALFVKAKSSYKHRVRIIIELSLALNVAVSVPALLTETMVSLRAW